MIDFLNTYGSNIAVVIAIFSFLITVIVQWAKISEAIRKLIGDPDKVSLFLFKVIAVTISGLVAGSFCWIFIDYIMLGKLNGPGTLVDITSGAAWGIFPALAGALGKNSRAAITQGILAGLILLLLQAPAEQMLINVQVNISKTDIFALIGICVSISIFCGLVGYRTRIFLETIPTGPTR